MANYYAYTRTNYFSVTDELKFREIIASCRSSEDEIQIFEDEQANGSKKFGFGCYGCIDGIPPADDEDDGEEDIDAFYDALQSVLSEGDAILITEVGYEKLRYLNGDCTVITKNSAQNINIREEAIRLARRLLHNNKFVTKNEY